MSSKKINIWKPFSLKDQQERTMKIENVLSLHFKRNMNEIWIAQEKIKSTEETAEQEQSSQIIESTPGTDDQMPVQAEEGVTIPVPAEQEEKDSRKWARWGLKSDDCSLRIVPVFPTLPLLVRPEYPFKLVPGATVRFYTRVPVWLQVQDTLDNNLSITEIPTMELSRTWFGPFTEGELCYWLQTNARRALRDDLFQDNLCVCTINISNNSDEELHLEKLCMRVDRMSIYQKGNQLWANEMDIIHKGGKDFSEIMVTEKLPDQAKDAVLVSPARNPQRKGIAERTFKMIHDLPGLSSRF